MRFTNDGATDTVESRRTYDYDTESDEEDGTITPLDRYFANPEAADRNLYVPQDVDLESGAGRGAARRPRGLLGLMLKLHDPRWEDRSNSSTATPTPALTPSSSPPASAPTSGTATPRHFFSSSRTHSANSLSAYLLGGSSSPSSSERTLTEAEFKQGVEEKLRAWKEGKKQKKSGISSAVKKFNPFKAKRDRIKSLIANTIDKHHYLVLLCRLLIRYGAPTHRLEGMHPQLPSV